MAYSRDGCTRQLYKLGVMPPLDGHENLIACRIFDSPGADIKLQITRSDKHIQKGWIHVPWLSPSWSLFSKVQAWKRAGEWPARWNEYEEQFSREMQSRLAQAYLKRIVLRLSQGKTVAIGCYCPDQYCHRFIVERLVAEKYRKGD